MQTNACAPSEFECPICLEEMRPPRKIGQCRLGHVICQVREGFGESHTGEVWPTAHTRPAELIDGDVCGNCVRILLSLWDCLRIVSVGRKCQKCVSMMVT